MTGDSLGWWHLTEENGPLAYSLLITAMALAGYGLLRRRGIPLAEVVGRCDRRLPWLQSVLSAVLLVVAVLPLCVLAMKVAPRQVVAGIRVATHPTWPLVLMGGVVGPVGEEFIVRGLVLNRLRRRYGATRAIVLAAVLFALVHDPVRAVAAFPAGLLFGLLYVRYRSLPAAVAAHSAVNLAALPVQHLWDMLSRSPAGPMLYLTAAAGGLVVLLRWSLPRWRTLGREYTLHEGEAPGSLSTA